MRQLLDHARRESPRECCGLLTLAGGDRSGADLRYHPARNVAASPARYEMHPDDLLAVLTVAEASGSTLWGLFHSHVRHDAFPSRLDREHAFYPEVVYLILSLWAEAAVGRGFRAFGAAVVRGYRLVDGVVEEVPLALAAADPRSG